MAEKDKSTVRQKAIQQLAYVITELVGRRTESLKLYEPLEAQEKFHRSRVRTRCIRGGNRGGKTLSACVEVARAVTRQDPFKKYPDTGIWYLVGKDWLHHRDTLYPKLFKPGAFKIIRDKSTGLMRAFRPWDPADKARSKDARPAAPLIPKRFISEVVWEDKKAQIPTLVKLKTGWELGFFSGKGEPPQGMAIDGALLDEEIPRSEWYAEMNSRVIDRDGCIIWSATPEVGTDQFYELISEAEQQSMLPERERTVEEHFISLLDNKHISTKAIEAMGAGLSEQEIEIKQRGNFASSGRVIFPEYNRGLHGIDYFQVPPQWTHFAAIDPGHQITAVLFGAVPDPAAMVDAESKYEIVLYDELYIRKCNAAKFAAMMKVACAGRDIEEWAIDMHGARLTDIGSGLTVYEQYRDALAALGLKSRRTGSGFTIGNADLKGGIGNCRSYLERDRFSGDPRIRIMCKQNPRGFRECLLPNFEWEIQRWKYKVEPKTGLATDEPEDRGRVHLMACFDEKTEVLTDQGWKRFADLDRAEKVATVNLQTDLLEYQHPTDYIVNPHHGDMIRFSGRKLNAMVTPDHRMIVYPRRGSHPIVKQAQELHVGDSLKLACGWKGENPKSIILHSPNAKQYPAIDAGDFAEFLGWYTAEGCRSLTPQIPGRGYEVTVAQAKPGGRLLLEELLQKIHVPFRSYQDTMYRASSLSLWQRVAECGDYCHSKKVPDWIKAATPSIIERFLDGLMLGDGWANGRSRVLVTSSQRLADDTQELLFKVGRSGRISLKGRAGSPWNIKGRSGLCKHDTWNVIERQEQTAGLRDSKHRPSFKKVHYTGTVYCVSVPNGTLITRREGVPLIAGNCFRYLCGMKPKFVPTPYKRNNPMLDQLDRMAALAKVRHSPPGRQLNFGPAGSIA